MRNQLAASLIILAGIAAVPMAHAAETITYSYDAKGRLVKVVHTGTVNNGITTDYTHDKADNRTNVKTTGAPS
jgi:YD repeat-containing protein